MKGMLLCLDRYQDTAVKSRRLDAVILAFMFDSKFFRLIYVLLLILFTVIPYKSIIIYGVQGCIFAVNGYPN